MIEYNAVLKIDLIAQGSDMIFNKQLKLAGAALLLASSVSVTNATEITGGVNLNVSGLGAFIAGDTGWSFKQEDRIRWRASYTGFSVDNDDFNEEDISDNDFTGEIKSRALQLGLDWYPFQNQFFLSGGLVSFDRSLDLDVLPGQDFDIGNQEVLPSDNIGLNVKLDHDSEAPYLSLGVGNKHAKDYGFAIFGEVGVMFPLDDPTGSFALSGNNGLVSASDLALEQRMLDEDLQNFMGGAQLIATFGMGYHF